MRLELKETSSIGATTIQWLSTLLGGLLAILAGVVTSWWTGKQAEGKARREQQRTYLRQKTQLRLAASELLAVLEPIASATTPPLFLEEELLYEKPVRPQVPDRSDRYYLKYDLVNTVYRLCAFLGWLELYRTDPAFLRGPPAESRRLEQCFFDIRNHLGAELQSDMKPVADARRDGFILEGDQRAIGEKMLSRRRTDFVIGYAEFCETLFRDPPRDNPTDDDHPTSQNWWIWNATRFFVEIGKPLPQIDCQASLKVVDLSLVRLSGVVVSLKEIARVIVQ